MPVTTFDNFSVGAIADLIGQLDAEAQAIEARIKLARAELTARGIDRAEGERFTVTRTESVRWTLNTAAVREALGEAWCTGHSNITPVVTFRTTVKRAALAQAA